MADSQIIKRIELTAAHPPTGKTRHFYAGEAIPAPKELRIVQFGSDPGYYLLGCDESGLEMTDTYHNSVQEAMAQAEFEFQVQESDWEDAGYLGS